MRFVAMLNPFNLAGSDIATEHQLVETLRELYNVKPHIAAAAGVGLASLSAGLYGMPWTGFWAFSITFACLLFRGLNEYRFVKRKQHNLERKWIRLFVFGSLLSGLGWGLSGALLLYDTPQHTRVIIVGVACAIVQGAAARSYMIPGTAFINILFVLGLMSMAALMDGNLFILPASILYFSFLSSFIVLMVKHRMRHLRAEQTTDHLLQEIINKNEQLRVANERLAEAAFEDALTGLANRRKFDMVLAETLETAHRDRAPLSLMLIDVDHFKAFNDTYGHQAGDLCLQEIAGAILKSGPEESCLVARYGGEEFVVILPSCDEAMALVAAERMRLSVALADLSSLPRSPPAQTISIGLVSCECCPRTTRETLLKAADEALYQAKRQGRNCVCTARHGEPLPV